MHLKVTVEEGSKSEAEQHSSDAHSSWLWVFFLSFFLFFLFKGKARSFCLLWKNHSIKMGIHFLKKTHTEREKMGCHRRRRAKVRQRISWLRCMDEVQVDSVLVYVPRLKEGGMDVNSTLKLLPSFSTDGEFRVVSLEFVFGFELSYSCMRAHFRPEYALMRNDGA